MSTATLPPPTAAPSSPAPPRVFLLRYAGTLLPLVAVLIALQFVGQLLPAGGPGWPVAVAAAAGWALAVAGRLRRRGWSTAGLVTVVAGPAALLALTATAGWLSPAGLLLWGPVGTVLAVALALAAGTDEGPGQRTDQGLHRWGE